MSTVFDTSLFVSISVVLVMASISIGSMDCCSEGACDDCSGGCCCCDDDDGIDNGEFVSNGSLRRRDV